MLDFLHIKKPLPRKEQRLYIYSME